MPSIETRTSEDGSITYRVKIRLEGFPLETANFIRKTDSKNWAQAKEAGMREGR